MMESTKILEAIKKSHIFKDKTKQDLILYFDKLNEKQKNWIIQAMKSEKIIVLNFLRSLKNKEVMSFEDIKNNIESLQRNKRLFDEKQEEKHRDEELSALLNNLDNL